MKNPILRKISLGTANFAMDYGISNNYKKLSIKNIKKIIRRCEKRNILRLDTAEGYNNCHRIIGDSIKKKWKITTKIPLIKSNDSHAIKKKIFELINKILKDLKTKDIEELLLHDENQLIKSNGKKIYKILKQFKKEKIIKNIGVSFYNKKKLNKTIKKFKIDVVQLPINYVNREFLEKDLLHSLKKKNIKIQARSIFHQGILLNKNIKFKKKRFNEHLKYIYNWHKIRNLNYLQTALGFFSKKPFISNLVIGVDSLKQLNQIINFKLKKVNEFPIIDDKTFLDLREITKN